MYRILLFTVLLMSSITGVLAQENDAYIRYEGDTFSLMYPDHWEINETDQLVQLRFEGYVLTLHTTDVRMGLPAGQFERRKLIGQYGIPVDVLLYEGNVKQVLYGRLEAPGTTLTIVLSAETGSDVDYDLIDIPQTIIDEASMSVSSIVFGNAESREVVVMPFFSGEINPIDAWARYTHPSQPFGFRYPDTWTLQESANWLILSRDEVQFVIAYAGIGDAPPVVDTELMLNSTMQIRVPIYGMFQAIPSQAVDPDNAGAVAVLYSPVLTADNYFTMRITSNAGNLVDWAIIDEVDMIISTFQTRPQPLATPSADSSHTGGISPASSQAFVHNALGFELEIPAEWHVEETASGVVLSQDTLQLLITTMPPGSLPAGDRITFSSITLDASIDVRRDHIVYQNRTKSVIYNYQGLDRIPLGDLQLFILLTDTNPDYDAIDLTEPTIAEVDRIVSTLNAV